jgi:predicted regulator of Ras-like GTPase activity (Roadblock/LC7/MglB family)
VPVKITLALRPILQALPPCQLAGDPASVSEDACIELPFLLIEPQLATGRIALGPSAFSAALPAEYRQLFKPGDGRAEVLIPLQDVLKSLPPASLQTRADQVQQALGADFSTPFSAQAAEDAKRFGTAGVVIPNQTVAAPKVEVATPPQVETPREVFNLRPAARIEPAVGEDKTLDAKAVVVELNNLSGVKGCALMFGDGLSLAGSLPPEYAADGLCAMGPSFMQRIKNHLVETKLGALKSMTLFCSGGVISFFVQENLCLALFHAGEELGAETRKQVTQAVHDLSQKYSHPV